jgi:hypothetical protein
MVLKMRQWEPKIGAIYLVFPSHLASNKRLRVKFMSFFHANIGISNTCPFGQY